METKKTPKADLENKKGLFLEIGLVVILAASLVAFNIKSYDIEKAEIVERQAIEEIEEFILNTAEELPPPPPPEPIQVQTEMVIVEDDAEIEVEVGLIDMSDDADNAMEDFTPVVVEEEVAEVEEEVFVFVEENPSFPGGDEKRIEFMKNNIKYPQLAKDNNITGRVFLKFVVEKDGSITNVRVVRDIGGGCGEEAMRVVKAMPKWNPGKQRGQPVRTEFNLPVIFSLQ